MLAVGAEGLVSSEPLLKSAPVDKVGGLALPFQRAGMRLTVAALGLHVGR